MERTYEEQMSIEVFGKSEEEPEVEGKTEEEPEMEGKTEEEYEVEQICSKRVVGGKEEYLIKWKGWDHADNTWEPVQHLDCRVLII